MKTKSIYLLFAFFSVLILLPSCGSDDSTETPEEEQNECVDYTPTSASNIINGVWEEPNNFDTYVDEITIPEDFGGGYVRVYLTQNHPDVRPALVINTTEDFSGGVIISGSSNQTNDELSREAFFSVYPGMNYSIEVSDFVSVPQDDYPINYTLEWEFISKVDCWEFNDTRATAKKVLLDETIEAYAIAGFRDWFVPPNSDQTFDWYKVKIEEAGKLEVEILSMPNDMLLQMNLYNEDGSSRDYSFEWTSPEVDPANLGRLSKITSLDVLSPGTYYITLQSKNVIRKSENDTQSIPNHFNTTYKLKTKVL